ncbi:von Willebrand factor C and EGF domain-containing protein-like [Uloborus diversus]|uniref:von Willebrand factor C and EGF domain-containing protein-like n=1 Tax=Uloborus diversus TaxID=327109 RepID=UPI002409D36A|nr:von Willebrand factor C and EGF domain-containing protein-like [Uloborus diversus]
MLMCYLRICPFMKPIGKECIIERNKEDCCPKIWCPEVVEEKNCGDSYQALEESQGGSGCYLNGRYFSEGSRLPVDPLNPCEICYCIRNSSTCVVQQCELHVEGCSPIYTEGQCCPCRYNCSEFSTSVTLPLIEGLGAEI